jgi:hypothetical protein
MRAIICSRVSSLIFRDTHQILSRLSIKGMACPLRLEWSPQQPERNYPEHVCHEQNFLKAA